MEVNESMRIQFRLISFRRIYFPCDRIRQIANGSIQRMIARLYTHTRNQIQSDTMKINVIKRLADAKFPLIK